MLASQNAIALVTIDKLGVNRVQSIYWKEQKLISITAHGSVNYETSLEERCMCSNSKMAYNNKQFW